MNREDIIRIAREAGFEALLPSEHVDQTGGVYVGDEEIVEILERFAAIVAAAEREARDRHQEEQRAKRASGQDVAPLV